MSTLTMASPMAQPPPQQQPQSALQQSRSGAAAASASLPLSAPSAASVYDRRRLISLIASSSQSAVAAGAAHASGSRLSLYSAALEQLSSELAKMSNVPWEKVARLCALCPPVPACATNPQLADAWTRMQQAFNAPVSADEPDGAGSGDDSDDECRLQCPMRWHLGKSRLAVVEGAECMDARVEGVWALARYLCLAASAGESARAAHLDRLLPVLLRFLLSLPFYAYDAINFPLVTPARVAHTTVSMLAQVATLVPEAQRMAGRAVLMLLTQCADAVLEDSKKSKAEQMAAASSQFHAVLEGVLSALGDEPFPLGTRDAHTLSEELHKLFQAKYSISPSLYGLVLRGMTALLAAHPEAYDAERLKYLFEHEFMRVTFQYPQPLAAAAGPSAPVSRRPSIGGGAAMIAESAQAMILVQTINLGVLVGLIATSHAGPGGIQVNCTPQEEESIKGQALHKLKTLLDQLLNVQPVEPAGLSGASALLSPKPSSSVPHVVIGCVDAARAILNGVMELANRYASDGQSIPNIVEAIRAILLSSRRLSKHPREKQLRYYLTTALSKVFKLELMQLQGHAVLATSLVRSASNQSLASPRSVAETHEVSMTARSRAQTELETHTKSTLEPPTRMVRSGSSHALNSGSASGGASAHGTFANSFTRSFVQSLLASLYKEDVVAHTTGGSSVSASSADAAKSSQLYERILVLLLDLVSLIDYAPLTMLVLPPMIARLTARPYFLHLIMPQLTDVALMEERRYSLKRESDAAAASHSSSAAHPSGLSADLKIFDCILNLFLQAYAVRPSDSDQSSLSRKITIEIPAVLLRIATELRVPALKRHLLKRVLRLTLDVAADARADELALAQHMSEQEKRKKSKKDAQPAPSNLGLNRTEECGFLLPIIAVLVRDCYAEQVATQAAAQSSGKAGTSPLHPLLGLQLYSNAESNVKWFRRLWFFLTSFHFTDALVAGAGVSGGGIGSTAISISDTWSESIRTIALYSPLLINTDTFADILSTELAKEYDALFSRIGSVLPSTASSEDRLSSAQQEKIRLKLSAAMSDSYRKQVTVLFPTIPAWEIAALPIGRVLFLLSFVHLETIRIKASCASVSAASGQSALAAPVSANCKLTVGHVSSASAFHAARTSAGSFHSLFAYLGHYPLLRMGLTKYVESFGSQIAFPLVVRMVFNEDITPARQSDMELTMQFLLQSLASRIALQRATALKFVEALTKSHVHLQWSTHCISTLLELLQVTQESLDTSVALDAQRLSSCPFASSRSAAPLNDVARLKLELDMPDDVVQRTDIHNTLLKLASSWLDNSKQVVPEQTNAVVQEFIQRVQRNLSRHTNRAAWHASLNLLLRSSSSADPLASWSLQSLPSIIGDLNVKERYLGEIKGLYRSYQESADRKRHEWIEAEKAAALTAAEQQQVAAALAAARPPSVTARSMSVLIQEESMDAFRHLLAHASPSALKVNAPATVAVAGGAGPQIPPFGRLLTAKLIQEGNQILHSFHAIHAAEASASEHTEAADQARAEKEGKLAVLHGRFERLLCLTAALLVWSTHARSCHPDFSIDTQDLLHLVVKAPSQIFTAESMETSVFVWEWILNAEGGQGQGQTFQLPLMIEMKAAWSYTVDRQVGLFSHRRQARTKETQKGLDAKKLPLAMQAEPLATPELEGTPQPHAPEQLQPVATPTSMFSVPSQGGFGALHGQLNSPIPPSDPLLLPNANASARNNMSAPSVIVAPVPGEELKTGAAPDLVRPSATLQGGGAAGSDAALSLDASTGMQSVSHLHADFPTGDAFAPHLLWINFMLRRFQSLAGINRDVINILASMLHKSFARPDLLSSNEKSFGCRFRWLLLGIKLIQGDGDLASGGNSFLDLRDKQLLRDRIYQSALAWFVSQPTWYDTGLPSTLKDDVTIILQFCEALQREDKFWTENGRPEKAHEERDASYPLPAAGSQPAASTSTTGNSKNRLAQLQKQRNLLVFLLSHELDRIHTWHAPLNPSSPALPASGSFTTHRSMYAPEWRTLIGAAWGLSPKLCVRLCQRFQQNAIVLNEITKLVQAQPALVYDLPEAVVFLVTEDVVRKATASGDPASSVLKHLIYWTPTTLPTAIWFLCAPFCHNRLVLEYAVHTLRSHPPENVMFYLSQIIQCLRNDSKDQLLYNFLRESSKASVLLSHQLLWLAQAELGEVKATTVYVVTPFRELIERLINDVIGNFDEVERDFFRDEFEFFEQITAISGILKPLPTKLERKEKIRQELCKVKLSTRNIYLPTNPQLQVCEIIPTSGAPMQSAAKVPILVAFKVRVGSLDLSVERAQQALKVLRVASGMHRSLGSSGGSMIARLEEAASKQLDDEERKEQRIAIRVDGTETSLNNRDLELAAAAAEASRLEADEIDLIIAPEQSENLANELNTALEREREAKLNAAKSAANSEGVLVQACIFKVGDDCRQDALALQVIQWCKNIMQANGLELWLYPYRVLPNRTGSEGIIGGIIECVPNSSTRDEIGKTTDCSLKDYFISKFGPPESASFQKAQRNFIVSSAAYAVTSYILQVKDRHNGNVMIDCDGHMIHIDFGFIFDISPANNLKFESAGFKLTQEMVELMGSDGYTTSPLVTWFQELVIRGFLAVREHRAEILALVEPMLISTLVCFKPQSLSGLKSRFFPDRDERGAAEGMLAIVGDAWNKWTTNVYDLIQLKQQGVYFFKGTSANDKQKLIKTTDEEQLQDS